MGKKEELLLLDGMEEWLGRCRPSILGKGGVAAAEESGATTLADILAAATAKDSPDSEEPDKTDATSTEGWAQGIGEGRADEDNVGAYYRFSEGAFQSFFFVSYQFLVSLM